MDFDEYQIKARKTALYPNAGNNFVYPTLGLCGETGEVAEKIKKIIRDKNFVIDQETQELLEKELGDVLWYLANICSKLKVSMDDVAKKNIEKLASRQQRGVIHGSGDNR